ncbi:soluble quino protein glucose dehydrogenase [Xylariaceae sp. FL0662B]|nr:soluble quino protein glucose dehydrogenase [Xylariaceae sp. FL0662B]
MASFPILGVLGLVISAVVAQNCSGIDPSAPLNISSDYTAQVILNGLNLPRGIVFDTAGNVLVVEQGGDGVRRVVLSESDDGNVCVESSSQLIPDRTLNHGIAFDQDGKTLFVSSVAEVHAYPYDAAAGTVGTKKTLIQGMQGSGHSTRTLLAPVTAPDILIVSRGSASNIDNETVETPYARSILKAFSIAELTASESAMDYAQGGEVLGWGLRNSVGVGEDPSTGGIWSVENSADDIHRSDVDLHNNNPAEELNYHGVVSDANNALKGLNYGYPACFAAWQTTDIPSNDAITVGSQFGGLQGTPFQEVTEATAMPDVDEFCRTQRQAPRLVFPAHTAPLDIKFTEDGNSAYVAFHGSWNRAPPDGFRLGKIAFENGRPTSEASDTAAVDYIIQNIDLTQCPGACIRPVGLAFDKKGRLFMTSDMSGELFVITTAT